MWNSFWCGGKVDPPPNPPSSALVRHTAKLSSGHANIPPSQARTALKKASSARKEMRFTTVATTKATEVAAPLEAASNTLLQFLRRTSVDWLDTSAITPAACLCVRSYSWSTPSSARSFNRDVSVSGQKALAMAREDGAVMTDAVRRCEALTLEQKQKSLSVTGPLMRRPGWEFDAKFSNSPWPWAAWSENTIEHLDTGFKQANWHKNVLDG